MPRIDILDGKRAHVLIIDSTVHTHRGRERETEGGRQKSLKHLAEVKFLINQRHVGTLLGPTCINPGDCIGAFFPIGLGTLNVTVAQAVQEILHPIHKRTHTHISEQPVVSFELLQTHFLTGREDHRAI